jgi:hypothetical protein
MLRKIAGKDVSQDASQDCKQRCFTRLQAKMLRKIASKDVSQDASQDCKQSSCSEHTIVNMLFIQEVSMREKMYF